MIKKERLEELIEQGAKIYGIGKKNNVFEFGLKLKNNAMYLLNQENFKKTDWYKKKLEIYFTFFETKEEAEWELEFGNITRTETLKLPSFNELQTKKEYYKNFALYFYLAIDMPYKKDTGAVIISQNDLKGNSYIIFDKPLTKENYIEACKLCKKLFLGEKVCLE